MGSQGFSTFDIDRLLGIPVSRLQNWLYQKLFKPSMYTSMVQGSKSLFSLEDLYTLMVFDFLVTKKRMSPKLAAKLIYSFHADSMTAKLERGRKYLVLFWYPDDREDEKRPFARLMVRLPRRLPKGACGMDVLKLSEFKRIVDGKVK